MFPRIRKLQGYIPVLCLDATLGLLLWWSGLGVWLACVSLGESPTPLALFKGSASCLNLFAGESWVFTTLMVSGSGFQVSVSGTDSGKVLRGMSSCLLGVDSVFVLVRSSILSSWYGLTWNFKCLMKSVKRRFIYIPCMQETLIWFWQFTEGLPSSAQSILLFWDRVILYLL